MVTGKIRLGDRVRDKVSGFEGVVVAVHQYDQGCDRMNVQPAATDGGTRLPEPEDFDVPNLELIEAGVVPYDSSREMQKDIAGDHLKFGDEVHDPISGVRGIVYARHITLGGGAHLISVQPQAVGNVKQPVVVVYAPRLEVIERGKVSYTEPIEKRRKKGGPKSTPRLRDAVPTPQHP